MIKKRDIGNNIKEVVMHNLGMSDKEFETEFLVPKEEYNISKIDDVATILKNAGNLGQKITIVGDYDVDGISASSILSLVFKKFGWNYSVRLPKRFSEGYGLSNDIIDEIDSGVLITVDNGITAIDAIKKAKDKGLIVIVTDHHLANADGILPCADIVIDPNAIDNTADYKSYCGAGIAYKLATHMLDVNDPLLPQLLSLAAVATVADVMPLTGENRFIVKNGLVNLLDKNKRTLGLGAVINECKFGAYISAKNIAFKVAPMLNAPGRLHDDGANFSLDLLTCNDSYAKALSMAEELSEMNDTRKNLKSEGVEKLERNMEENCLFCENPLVFYEPDLPEGLVGILAGQFAEKYRVPCFVLTDSEDKDILKGSGRSYGGINIKELLDKNADLIEKYGGHAEAAGISVRRDKFSEFKDALVCELAGLEINMDDTVYYDLEIDAKDINNALNELEKYAPFGEGNPEPIFLIKNFSVSGFRYMQEGMSVRLTGGTANAVCFDMGKKYLEMGEPKVLNLVGTLARNSYLSNVTNQVEVMEILPKENAKPASSMAELLAKMARERR